MEKTRTIQFRVTKEQHERIVNKALAKGYKTTSSYLLSAALQYDLALEERVEEINHVLKRLEKHINASRET